jgi:hypothetical protein
MKRALACLLALGMLAACDSFTPGASILTEVRTSVRSILEARRTADAPAPALDPLIDTALAGITGPLSLAVAETTLETALLAEFGVNGAFQTFTTPSRQNVTLQNGVMTATRGLGYDLLSAQATPTVALITGRRTGEAPRQHRYLTIDGTEVALDLWCRIELAGTELLVLQRGAPVQTQQMAEICRGPGRIYITNLYWVGADGYIWQSRQWVSPEYGNLAIQTLRR